MNFGPSWSYPKPVQAGGPPVWLGAAGSNATLSDVVDWADGWMPVEGTEPIQQRWAELRHLAVERGRDPDTIELVVFGSAGDVVQLDQYQAWGASLVVVGTAAADHKTVAAQLDHYQPLIERYARSTP